MSARPEGWHQVCDAVLLISNMGVLELRQPLP